MTFLASASAGKLSDRHDRACARLATIAILDTINGGARALRIAKRLEAMGSSIPADEIVSDVYSASTGRSHPRWSAWKCPECWSVHLGQDAACACCALSEEADEELEEED